MIVETYTEEFELDIRAEVDYSPATDDVPYLPNGDPGYPGDAERLEIIAVEWRPTADAPWRELERELTPCEIDRVETEARRVWEIEVEDSRA